MNVALNSFKEMVLGLSFNFSIFPEELLTSMVYMGVDVTTYNITYGDSLKVCAIAIIPHELTTLNGFDVPLM